MADAGWYNDEIDPTLARWFDGAGWTDHTLVKADWEGAGQGPPPPEELEDLGPFRPGGPRQLRLAIAGAAAIAVLVVGGVALAARDDGRGDPAKPTSTDRQGSTADRVDDGTTTGSDVTIDVADADLGTGAPGSEVDSAVGGTGSSKAGTGSSKTTPSTAKSTVQHTSTLTETHTNNRPVGEATKGDQESIGSKTDKSIQNTYEPPPPPPPEPVDPGPSIPPSDTTTPTEPVGTDS